MFSKQHKRIKCKINTAVQKLSSILDKKKQIVTKLKCINKSIA